MRCGVVTVYSSENCGSFLQAYALTKAINKIGHQSTCVRHNFPPQATSKKKYILDVIKMLIKMNFSGARLLVGRKKAFRNAISSLDKRKIGDGIDCYVLGSDTVWDVTQKFFKDNYTFFWGTEFQDKKVISYAASLGYAKASDIAMCPFVPSALENMVHIGVREDAAKDILAKYTEKEISVVCDPTILLNKSDYESIAPTVEYKDYIFIYNYGKMPQEYVSEIKKIAKNEGLKTIIFGGNNEWCDISLPYDPYIFLGLIKNAKYVFTNTFHGTVFSHILEKRFAIVNCGKVKVTDFLRRHGTLDKYFDTPEMIEGILKSEFDYDKIRDVMRVESVEGLRYLKAAIEE